MTGPDLPARSRAPDPDLGADRGAEAANDVSAQASRAGADTFELLFQHTPTPIWRLDARAAQAMRARLQAQGVGDVAAHVEAHPALIDGVLEQTRVIEANPAAALLFRAGGQAELAGPARYLFSATPGLAKRLLTAHFEGRQTHVEQGRVARFDGEPRDVVFSAAILASPERRDTTFITVEDITDRLRAETQLRRLRTDVAHAARISMLGELATSIAHEVRQPLAAIVTNAETSLRWLAHEQPNLAKVRELTTRIVASAQRANDIIQRVREVALNRAPEQRPLQLADVVGDALQFVRNELDVRGIDLSVAIAGDVPTLVGDRVQLQQMVLNLLVNGVHAIDQAPSSARRLEVEVVAAPGGAAVLTVRDTGLGVAEADLPRIFDSFFTTKPTGMGIGLAICRSIVVDHGGDITAANHPAGGAVFRVTLPSQASTP